MRLDQWLAVTLLNVFLAIAVDNLADAQELTNAEENQAKEQEQAVRHDIAALTNDADTEVSSTPHIISAMFPPAFALVSPMTLRDVDDSSVSYECLDRRR